jgi:hypothetical protein
VSHFQNICYLSLCPDFALHFGDETYATNGALILEVRTAAMLVLLVVGNYKIQMVAPNTIMPSFIKILHLVQTCVIDR